MQGVTEMMYSQMMQQFQGDPLFSRAQEMAKGRTDAECQQVAENLCKNLGIDLNQAYGQYQQFCRRFGGRNAMR